MRALSCDIFNIYTNLNIELLARKILSVPVSIDDTHRQVSRQTQRQVYAHAGRHTGRQPNRQAGRQANVQPGSQTDTVGSSVADPGSGIGYLFGPWIRDPGWEKVGIRIRDPG